MRPPRIKPPGRGQGRGVPSGYVLGRSSRGTGDVELLDTRQLAKVGIATSQQVANSSKNNVTTTGTLTNHAVIVGRGIKTVASIAVGGANTFLAGAAGADPTWRAPVLASADFANEGTATTVLHGNAAGNPSWSAISLTVDVSGILPVANGGTGAASLAAHGVMIGNGTGVVNAATIGTAGRFLVDQGSGLDPIFVAPTAGTGISLTGGASPTINNTGVIALTAGTGISLGGTVANETITNSGVTSLTAGANITLSAGTGAITISSSGGGGSGLTAAGAGLTVASAGTVSLQTALPNGETATTQADGDNSTKVATDQFVQTAVNNAIAGVNPAVAVQAATTAASNTSSFTYNNGASGIGATFTGTANTAVTIDGFTFTALGQRLLVKNDTQSPSGAFNGVYYVTQVQTTLLPPILTRALDYDQPSDMNNTGAIPVVNGTVNGSTSWVLTSQVTTVGTDPLTYTQFTLNPTTLVTAAATLTNHGVVLGGGSRALTATAAGAANTLLHGNGAADPTFSAVDLTADVTGVLPVTGGGTGIATAAAHGLLVGNGVGTINVTGAGTSGQVLTSNGASADPTFQANAVTSGNLLNVRYLTVGTTYTPTAGTNSVILELLGGGGGGGGCPAGGTNTASLAPGGPGGGWLRVRLTANFSGATYAVGAAGIAGTAGANAGGAGGNTTFTTTGGSPVTYTAAGGTGGNAGIGPFPLAWLYAVSAQATTTTSGGDISFSSEPPLSAFALSSGNLITSGGGPSPYSRGAAAKNASGSTGQNLSGNAADGHGGGGGGAGSYGTGSSAQAGGQGSAGIIIVYEYA